MKLIIISILTLLLSAFFVSASCVDIADNSTYDDKIVWIAGKAFVNAVELRVCHLYELFISVFDKNENSYYFTPLNKENIL